MTQGRFIALEGGEGAGKSTQCALLAKALAERGIAAVTTREPGGTPGAEAIRNLLLAPVSEGEGQSEGWGARAEALLFAAARADHVERLIRPALDRGQWVICDRYVDSSRAYQGGGGGLSDADIIDLHRIGSGGLLPDLSLLIEVSPEVSARRLGGRGGGGPDRIEAQPASYHQRVANAFRSFVQAEPGRFSRIDGDHPAADVHAQIMAALRARFEALR